MLVEVDFEVDVQGPDVAAGRVSFYVPGEWPDLLSVVDLV